jgi:lipopolysaccharide transport system permease protein
LYVNERQTFLLSIFAHQYRALIILAHNIPIIIVLIIWSSSVSMTFDPLYPFYILGVITFLFFTSYVFAVLSTRYRDMIQLIGSVMQISFLISPVMWNINMLPVEVRGWVFVNPIAAGLEILRNPLIGWSIDSRAFISLAAWTVLAIILAVVLHRRMDRSTIFWI